MRREDVRVAAWRVAVDNNGAGCQRRVIQPDDPKIYLSFPLNQKGVQCNRGMSPSIHRSLRVRLGVYMCIYMKDFMKRLYSQDMTDLL